MVIGAGHLAFMAAALGSAGTTQPVAVAGWSAPLELKALTDPTTPGDYGCDESSDNQLCWQATNNYLNCTASTAPYTPCVNADRYTHASRRRPTS